MIYFNSKKEDINALILRLKNTDLLQTILKTRPNSKWSVYVKTNKIVGDKNKLYFRK